MNYESFGERLPSAKVWGFMLAVSAGGSILTTNVLDIVYILPLVVGALTIGFEYRVLKDQPQIYHSYVNIFILGGIVFSTISLLLMYTIRGLEVGTFDPIGLWFPYLLNAVSVSTVMWTVLGTIYADSEYNRKRKERLAKKYKTQSERIELFASALSHDLRNPLSIIGGYVDLLEERIDDEDEEYVEEITTGLERANQIVEDSLSLARSGADPERREVCLADVAQDAWGTSETGDLELVIDSDETIMADRSYLKQSLENLFRNSEEHAVNAEIVAVGSTENGFYVEDDGDETPDQIIDSRITYTDEVVGFGLSIVTFLAEKHGWTVVITEGGRGGVRTVFKTDSDLAAHDEIDENLQ